ncbi:hypothetical protein [Saccharibacillus deserti]|uniref:hypothetical protein n=1 Tax=Saccharibacillus deserti TaxID=1634444 RepID=UPI0015526461|nr:hypothetical protein [Saccharibacillus deserti]
MNTHLGIKLRNKEGGSRLTLNNYIPTGTKAMTNLPSDELAKGVEKLLNKFTLNMNYFQSLSKDEFNKELNKLVEKNDFVQIEDMNSLSNVSGYYIMVLDAYCQIYIGISKNIKRRIMEHWSTQIPLSQLLLTTEGWSIPIDCFRALDTTRVFICCGNEENFSDDHMSNMMREDLLIYRFPVDYCLNIATFWGSPETHLERLKSVELKDLKIYGTSPLTRVIELREEFANRRGIK